MRILYCVIHTKKQNNRVDNIINTWGSKKDLIFYSDHEDSKLNIIKVSGNSEYNSGQEKQIKFLQIVDSIFPGYDWYMFCDNDTFINTTLLEREIQDFKDDSIYGEMINCWPEDYTLSYPSGGAGFAISSRTIKYLSDKVTQHNVIWSDVSLGLNLRKLKINTIDRKDVFHSQKPSHYNISHNQVHKHITFHYITQFNEMSNFHRICNRS
jgi:hypothetical protein